MREQCLAPVETMQLHELLTLKNLSLTKAVTTQLLVSDDELKEILKNDAAAAEQQIKKLRRLIQKLPIAIK